MYYSIYKCRLESLQNKFIRFLYFKMSSAYTTLNIYELRSTILNLNVEIKLMWFLFLSSNNHIDYVTIIISN